MTNMLTMPMFTSWCLSGNVYYAKHISYANQLLIISILVVLDKITFEQMMILDDHQSYYRVSASNFIAIYPVLLQAF